MNYVNGAEVFILTASLLLDAGPGTVFQREAQKYNGFFIGSGFEYAINWWPGLFWKTEYRFADYRSKTTPLNCISCELSEGTGLAERVHPYVQTVRTELVWRFGGFGKGPVSARY